MQLRQKVTPNELFSILNERLSGIFSRNLLQIHFRNFIIPSGNLSILKMIYTNDFLQTRQFIFDEIEGKLFCSPLKAEFSARIRI